MKPTNLIKQVTNPFNLKIKALNLNFYDKMLEKEFSDDYKVKNLALGILFTLSGTFFFGSFYIIYDMTHPTWFIGMILLSLFLGTTLNLGFFRRYRSLALFIYSIIFGGSYTHRMLFYDGSDIGALAQYFMGLMLIILAVNFFLRMKFVNTVLLNLVFFLLFLAYSIIGIHIDQISPSYFRYSCNVYLCTVIVVCIAIYNNEYLSRNAFMQQKTILRQADELMRVNAQTEQTVIQRTHELEVEKQKSYKAIIEGQQIERQRIAQDLHDSLTIQLISIKRGLELNQELCKEDCIDKIDHIIGQVREISHNLLPYSLKHFGLIKAVDDMCISLQSQQNLGVHFSKIGISDDLRWDNVIETEIYKIIQELITNIVKHANASHILLELIYDDNIIYLTVEDDGNGFCTNYNQTKRFGLYNIEARLSVLGGTLSLDSRPGKGTTVMINIPA